MSTNAQELKTNLKKLSATKRADIESKLGHYAFDKAANESDEQLVKEFTKMAKTQDDKIKTCIEFQAAAKKEIDNLEKIIDSERKLNRSTSVSEANLKEAKKRELENLGELEKTRKEKMNTQKSITAFNAKITKFKKDREELNAELKELGININLQTFDQKELPKISLFDDTPPPSQPKSSHPFGTPGRSREQLHEEKLSKTGFLTNCDILEKNLKNIKADTGIRTDTLMIVKGKNGVNYEIDDKSVSCTDQSDEAMSHMMDIFIECERSKAEAAGKLAEFDIAKIGFKAKGPQSEKLEQMCKERGIGTKLNQTTENKKEKLEIISDDREKEQQSHSSFTQSHRVA